MLISLKMKALFPATALAIALALSGAPVKAEMGSMHVAFGDIPGADMLNFLTAVKRAEARGVKVKVSYLQSEDTAVVREHLLDDDPVVVLPLTDRIAVAEVDLAAIRELLMTPRHTNSKQWEKIFSNGL